jgi:hypothetical protein
LLIFLTLAKVFLGVGTPCNCTAAFPRKEGRIQELAGPASSSQNGRILIENPLSNKAGQKNLAKIDFDEFTSMENFHLTTFDRMHLAKSKI